MAMSSPLPFPTVALHHTGAAGDIRHSASAGDPGYESLLSTPLQGARYAGTRNEPHECDHRVGGHVSPFLMGQTVARRTYSGRSMRSTHSSLSRSCASSGARFSITGWGIAKNAPSPLTARPPPTSR